MRAHSAELEVNEGGRRVNHAFLKIHQDIFDYFFYPSMQLNFAAAGAPSTCAAGSVQITSYACTLSCSPSIGNTAFRDGTHEPMTPCGVVVQAVRCG